MENMEKERNRNLMLYEFKCGHSAAAATRNICRIEGARTVKESTCRRWFAKFLNGEEGLKDESRSGRKNPSSIVVELSFWDKDGWKSLTITANI
jgi:transposase